MQARAYKYPISLTDSSSNFLFPFCFKNKMRLLNVLLVLTTLPFLISMHAYNACRILHGEEQKLMNKSLLLGSLEKGHVPPSAPNSGTYIPASTINSRAFGGHNFALLMGSLQRGHVPLSAPNPGTHIPGLKLGQKAFAGHNIASLLNSLQKGLVPPSAPNPGTHIPTSTLGQRPFARHNMTHLLLSLQKGRVPSSEPNPTIP
jgi:hypothetical protein